MAVEAVQVVLPDLQGLIAGDMVLSAGTYWLLVAGGGVYSTDYLPLIQALRANLVAVDLHALAQLLFI